MKTTRNRSLFSILAILSLATVVFAPPLLAQDAGSVEKVLTLHPDRTGPRALPADRGATGVWQRLLKLQTVGSVLYTDAHPDDEQGGTLTYLSRGRGVRTALLSLNRGESGANAIGSELFEGLGMIRTEELILAGRYYGLDDLYFTTMLDYGFSKSLDEALDQWGRENVLRDVVRIIRINRPTILISRFHGSDRDGHGNHQASGVITQEAFDAAGDPNRFPEQISQEGLRPWHPLKLYRSNLRPRRFFGGSAEAPTERWQVRVNAGEFSPWLGQSFQDFSSEGLSYQRSQTSGRRRGTGSGSYYQFFERLKTQVEGPDKEADFFDGIDTSVTGVFRLVGESTPTDAIPLLQAIESSVAQAMAAYNVANPSAVVPFLSQGLNATRDVLQLASGAPEATFMLRIKEKQFMDAINTAVGLDFTATAVPAGTEEPSSPFSAAPVMGVVVPGQKFDVQTNIVNGGSIDIRPERVEFTGSVDWFVDGSLMSTTALGSGGRIQSTFRATTPADAQPTARYHYRESVRESKYQLRDPRYVHLPHRTPPMTAVLHYRVGDVPVVARSDVFRREANLPYGYESRLLKIAPAIAVNLEPESVIVPLGARNRTVQVEVDLLNNSDGGGSGELRLSAPEGWTVRPAAHSFQFTLAGERRNFRFTIQIPRITDQTYRLEAIATSGGREYREGYQVIEHRDYETNYIYSRAVAQVSGIDVNMARNLRVGYIMGVGDEVPAGIEQLGAQVQLLTAQDLADSNLSQYNAIVVGTRAYAVRDDLITYNQRLLDYAKAGGNLIVLYNTQEFVPNQWAAFPAELPRRAEEVSEEDSPVRILAPDHIAFNKPNKITAADFDGWVEQRGSKFFSSWDSNYVPMIETQDRRQDPQQGGWLIAKYGDGYYTYFAYAVHRQFPYGVAGMYRIFANLLSMGAD